MVLIWVLCFSLSGTVQGLDSGDQATLNELQKELEALKLQVEELRRDLDATRKEQQNSLLFKTPDAKPATVPSASHVGQEKCKVVDGHGNGMIKPYTADSGDNLAGDANAWIWVPYGQCKKINKGDFSGVSSDIRNKINDSNIQYSPAAK
jgi:hypothetical protein